MPTNQKGSLVRSNIVTEKLVRHFYHFENPLYTDVVPLFQKLIIGIKTFGFYVGFLLIPYPFRNYYGANVFDLSSELNTYFFIAIVFVAVCSYFIYKFKHKLLAHLALFFFILRV